MCHQDCSHDKHRSAQGARSPEPPARPPSWYHKTNMYSIVEATLLAPIRSLLCLLDEPYRSRRWALERGGTAARTDFRLVPEGPSLECKPPSMRDDALLENERRASVPGSGWIISPMGAPRDTTQQLAGQLLAQLESRHLTWGVIINGNVWITFRCVAPKTCHVLPPILASHTSARQRNHPVNPDALAQRSRQHCASPQPPLQARLGSVPAAARGPVRDLSRGPTSTRADT